MNLSFRAFTEELLLIKQAAGEITPEQRQQITSGDVSMINEEEVGKPPARPNNAAMFKRLALNALAYGGGIGLGSGLGYVAAEKLLSKAFPALTSRQRMLLSGGIGGLGALGALATWQAMKDARKSEDDAGQRDNQIV